MQVRRIGESTHLGVCTHRVETGNAKEAEALDRRK